MDEDRNFVQSPSIDPRAQAHTVHTPAFVPCLELAREILLLPDDEGGWRELPAAVLRVTFDYAGTAVSSRGDAPAVGVVRDVLGESAAHRSLERFGVIDLDCMATHLRGLDSDGDYVIDLESDPDALCRFELDVVPKLRSEGWVVSHAADYPCSIERPQQWYAELEAADDDTDWFELRLGVEVNGERVDLLPIVLDLLQSSRRDLDLRLDRSRYLALPLGQARYLPVAPDRIRPLLAVVRELYENEHHGAGVRVPALVPAYVDELRQGLATFSGMPSAAVRCPRTVPSSVAELEPAAAPAALRADLRPYQRIGLAWMQRLAELGCGGILADDMGLGKTLQTIAHLCALHAAGRLSPPALVVAPTSLIRNWQRELRRFAPHLRVLLMHAAERRRRWCELDRADVVITTYPLIVRDEERYEGKSFSVLVLDEAQTIKNVRSQAHRAVSRLEAEQVIALSGTPVENNLEELRAVFDVVMPGVLGDAAEFRIRFRDPIERMGDVDRLAQLRKRIAPFVLRRLKRDVARELPPKTEMIRAVDLEGEQRELYEAIRIAAHASVRSAIRKKGIDGATVDILGALMKLRQVCCDPRLVPLERAQHVTESSKLTALLDMVAELRAEGRRMLIFSQFTSMLTIIANELHAQGHAPLLLTGETQDRQAVVDAFERGVSSVFLVSLKAGGTGLNLTSADTVIHYEPWWNPAAHSQATDRAYRIGQRKPVHVYNLVAAGSVEERMLGLQRRKQRIADGLLESGEAHPLLSEGDVEDLFAPLA